MLNPRTVCIAGFTVCAGLLGYAFYMEHVMMLEPCPLCWLQRGVFLGFAIVFLICAVHRPTGWGRYIYSLGFAVLTLLGAGLAGRQLWLQSLPPDQVPECGLGVTYMLEVAPLLDVISWAARGTGECAEVQWIFLGLSIPGWTLLFFVALGTVAIFSMLRRSAIPQEALA